MEEDRDPSTWSCPEINHFRQMKDARSRRHLFAEILFSPYMERLMIWSAAHAGMRQRSYQRRAFCERPCRSICDTSSSISPKAVETPRPSAGSCALG